MVWIIHFQNVNGMCHLIMMVIVYLMVIANLLPSLNPSLFSLSSVILLCLSQNLIQLSLVIVAMGNQPMSPIYI